MSRGVTSEMLCKRFVVCNYESLQQREREKETSVYCTRLVGSIGYRSNL